MKLETNYNVGKVALASETEKPVLNERFRQLKSSTH